MTGGDAVFETFYSMPLYREIVEKCVTQSHPVTQGVLRKGRAATAEVVSDR